ncbi:MAG: serine hydroxymethyltransferase [Syntrophaceticus sp.]
MDLIERYLMLKDTDLAAAIRCEEKRQQEQLELVASENYTSQAVMAVQGSVLTNKYAEGYPSKRYYGGCECVDLAEELAIRRAEELFGAEHANVQPHSGALANMAVYYAALKPGDRILGMALAHGGHLTHGFPANISGKYYENINYGVNSEGFIDYEEVRKKALQVHPKMIIAGASAYPRVIDFQAFAEIAQECEAYLMVDMAHIAGLVAAKVHPSPVSHAHFVTSTTHKTLGGPRGGLILCQEQFAKKIDSAVFPGLQGGPLMHVIAAKALCLKEAGTDKFRNYIIQVVQNAAVLGEVLKKFGFSLVSGGTDNHMLLVDLRSKNLTGKAAELLLGEAGITVNKNMVPGDPQSPQVTSGIRIGTPTVTSRGMGEKEMEQIGTAIHLLLSSPVEQGKLEQARQIVQKLCKEYPVYNGG